MLMEETSISVPVNKQIVWELSSSCLKEVNLFLNIRILKLRTHVWLMKLKYELS
jgi:hypothetical protein